MSFKSVHTRNDRGVVALYYRLRTMWTDECTDCWSPQSAYLLAGFVGRPVIFVHTRFACMHTQYVSVAVRGMNQVKS
jgi:hypothetical protein